MRRTRKNGTPGMTLQAICGRLNFEGISTRTFSTAHPRSVQPPPSLAKVSDHNGPKGAKILAIREGNLVGLAPGE